MPLELCHIAKGQRRLKLSPEEQVRTFTFLLMCFPLLLHIAYVPALVLCLQPELPQALPRRAGPILFSASSCTFQAEHALAPVSQSVLPPALVCGCWIRAEQP